MDYLHGDVVDNEFEAACYYEYARRSVLLCEAARLWPTKKAIDTAIEKKFPGILSWSFIWKSPSFPRKSWNQLSARERRDILCWLAPRQILPLGVNEVWHLMTWGVFDQLNAMAAKVGESYRPGKRRRLRVYPIVEDRRIVELSHPKKKQKLPLAHVIVTMNFAETRKRLVRAIDKWLQLPENKARFAAHAKNPIGKSGVFKDRLKDLAVSQIYDGCGDWEKANAFADKHRLRHRPFHDPRQGQAKTSLHEARLFSEESGFLNAKKRARSYRAELFPWESWKSTMDAERSRNELAKFFRRPLKRAGKISKRSP
jgi:hypothetical protein